MKKIIVAGIAGWLLVLTAATSLFAGSGAGVGVKVGTLGLGAELTFKASNYLGARAGINILDWSIEETIDDIDYDASLDFFSLALLADYHPFGGIFRISVGVVVNDNEVSLSATPTDTVTMRSVTFTAAEVGTLSGSVEFLPLSPYIGIGWSSNTSNAGGWGFNLDLGILYHGAPDITSYTASGTLSGTAQLETILDEQEAIIEDYFDKYTIYPVVSFSIQYLF